MKPSTRAIKLAAKKSSGPPPMRMLKENFEAALILAIARQTLLEAPDRAKSPTFESAFLAGLKEVLYASQEGRYITIYESFDYERETAGT